MMYKYLFRIILGVVGFFLILGVVVGAENSQIINISGFNADGESGQLIQSFTQKWNDLELYFLSNTGNISHYTMMDRNMGATEVYNQRFGLGKTNTGSFGYYYQWGNNYGFDRCYSGNCSDYFTNNSGYVTTIEKNIWSGYILSKYARNTRSTAQNWMDGASIKDNIRGGMGDRESYNGIGTKIDRQGPCPNGYYVPSVNDLSTMHSLWEKSTQNYLNNMVNQRAFDLLLPYNGQVIRDKTINYLGDRGYYWTSSPHLIYTEAAYSMGLGAANFFPQYNCTRTDARAVRCLKNTKNENVIFLHPNGGIKAVVVLDGKKITTLDSPLKTGNDDIDLKFLGRYSTENFVKGTKVNTGDMVGSGMNLYARRSGDNEIVIYQYNANGGKFSGGQMDILNYYAVSGEVNTDVIETPVMTGYTFDGWYDELTGGINVKTEEVIDNKLLYAHWSVNQYKIIFDVDGVLTTYIGDYGSLITDPINPTKNGYRFIKREPNIPTTMPAEDLTIKAVWEKLGSSGGGGGSSETTKEEKKPVEPPQSNDNIQNIPNNTQQGQNNSQVTSNYSPEFQEAYEFAKENGITTMLTIEKADINGKLTRIQMAKMLSQYAINVLGKAPDTSKTIKFNDVTDKRDADYDNGVTLAYQLGIMGQNMPGNNFRPDDEVSRAEFATALSRMLYNTSDGQYKSTDKYYTNHMSKLVKEGIITKDDPKMKELRGYVMIMLMRSAK